MECGDLAISIKGKVHRILMVTLCFAHATAMWRCSKISLKRVPRAVYRYRQELTGLFLTGADQFCLREDVPLHGGFNVGFGRVIQAFKCGVECI